MTDIDKLLEAMQKYRMTPANGIVHGKVIADLERLVLALNQDLHDRSRYGLTSDTLKAELATKYGVGQ